MDAVLNLYHSLVTDGMLAIAHMACVSPLLSNGSEVEIAFLAMQTKPGPAAWRGHRAWNGNEQKLTVPWNFQRQVAQCANHSFLVTMGLTTVNLSSKTACQGACVDNVV